MTQNCMTRNFTLINFGLDVFLSVLIGSFLAILTVSMKTIINRVFFRKVNLKLNLQLDANAIQ